MMQTIEQLARQSKSKKQPSDDDFIELHHDFMVCYGWIPLAEFKKLPIRTLLNLNEYVQEEKRKREEARLVFLKFVGIKNPK